jgi:hypothetical protein
MISRALGLGLVSASLAVVAGCSSNPSTMVRVPSDGPMPSAVDGRTGVLAALELLPTGRYRTSLRRIEDGAYVSLTPAIPDDENGEITAVRWFETGALATDLGARMFRFSGGAWETLDVSGCAGDSAVVVLGDAVALDDAWLFASTFGSGESTLCHFDGSELSSSPLPFEISSLAEVEGALVAVDAHGAVRRQLEGGDWSELDGFPEEGATYAQSVVRSDAMYLRYASTEGEDHWWRITATSAARVSGGIPGMNGETWRVELDEATSEQCGYSLWSGMDVCTTRVDLAEYRVLRTDGAAPVEVGYLRLEQGDITWYETMVVGPGQLLLAGSSGQLFVTAP